MMWNCDKHHISIVGVVVAAMVVICAWSVAVVLRKLIGSAIGGEDFGEHLAELEGHWSIIFLDDISFQWALVVCVVSSLMVSLGTALQRAMSEVRSAHTGRELRRKILQAAIGSSQGMSGAGGGQESDIGFTANELIMKVKIIEDFIAYDESDILVRNLVLGMALVLPFIFAWYAGVCMIGLLLCSEASSRLVERVRTNTHLFLEENTAKVNARLLDIIKNGTKIKIMGTSWAEQHAMRELEKSSDHALSKDALLKFLRELLRLSLISLVPAVIASISWHIIQNTSNPAEAVNTGFAVVVAILMADEGHKSLIFLSFIFDRKVMYDEARKSIDEFVAFSVQHTEDDTETMDTSSDSHLQDYGELSIAKDAVALDGVSLTYPGREVAALRLFSRLFQAKKTHGLVGESGSGKSTALKLIARLLRPDEGAIHIWPGAKVAYVSQDQKLFARTIRENVTHGHKSEASVKDDTVWDALKKADIHEWVASLPNGLDTHLEDGEKMISGGQLQRLHLAHLFCACSDADIVLLDEVLSAVDQTRRELLINRLEHFLYGKTAIIITHHREMLRLCHEVHTMEPIPGASEKEGNTISVFLGPADIEEGSSKSLWAEDRGRNSKHKESEFDDGYAMEVHC